MERTCPAEVAAVAKLFYNGGLPLNRKEVYFTATVLPGIICADNFKYFGRFLELLGIKPPEPVNTDNTQSFTEYSLSRTIKHPAEQADDYDGKRQQPDLLILIEGSPAKLIIVEAKMYSPASKQSLVEQMHAQEAEIYDWARGRSPEPRIVHAALLPDQMMKQETIGALDDCDFAHADKARPIITWQQILKAFEDVNSAAYFLGVLTAALDRYPELACNQLRKENCDAQLPGVQIVAKYLAGDREYQMMGRIGGIHGARLREDVATQKWLTHEYEVRKSDDPLQWWFPISDFVKLVTDQPQARE